MCDYEFAKVIYSCRNLIKGNNYVFKYIDSVQYPELSRHENTITARKIIINHLRATLAVCFIKEVYEEVTEYINYILKMGAMSGQIKPERISDSVKVSLTANRLLATTTHEEVISMVTREIYQVLEAERSTLKLIKNTCKRLDLDIPGNLIENTLKYLEMRHIFVHEDGKPNKEFKQKFPDVNINRKGRINLTEINLHTVRDSIKDLIQAIDEKMIAKNLIIESEKQP